MASSVRAAVGLGELADGAGPSLGVDMTYGPMRAAAARITVQQVDSAAGMPVPPFVEAMRCLG